MKKYILLLICSLPFISKAQSTAETATRFTFNNSINYMPPAGTPMQPGPDYGCLQPGLPSWFYFTVCGSEDSVFNAKISANSVGLVGLIIWGPFDDTTNIVSQLTAANIDTCYLYIGGFMDLPMLQTGKTYYGMFSIDTGAVTYSMTQMFSGGYWFDQRCDLCNGRVANYKQEVCMVTLDSSTQKNMIVWEKKYPYQISSYNIYRETIIANQWDSIGNVPATSSTFFIDNAVNPFQRSYRYKVSGVDSCGRTVMRFNNHSDSVSTPHATIHTLASPGFNGEVNLSWNAYEGFSYNTFYIYRGSSPTSMQVLDSVASTSFSYSDYNPIAGSNYYKVTVKRAGGCSPDGGITVYTQAMSNMPYANIVDVNEISSVGDFKIYPNPSSGSFKIELKNSITGLIRIYDVNGNIVMQEQIDGPKFIDTKLSSGIYNIVLTNETINLSSRFLIE